MASFGAEGVAARLPVVFRKNTALFLRMAIAASGLSPSLVAFFQRGAHGSILRASSVRLHVGLVA